MLRDVPVKVLLVLGFLVAGVLPVMVVSLVTMYEGQEALRARAFRQLESVRDMKKRAIERFFADRLSDVRTAAADPYVQESFADLCNAFEAAGGVAGGRFEGQDHEQFRAPDSYRRIHDRYYAYFALFIGQRGYYDLFLLDAANGDICFSVKKERDFASRAGTSPSSLGDVWKAARTGAVALSDTKPYGPSADAAAQFVAAPLPGPEPASGVLAMQVSMDAVNAVMTDRSGMGESGESYLVGPDFKMRSDAPLAVESHSVAASFGGTVVSNGVDNPAVRAALVGESGSLVHENYLGRRVLSAYAPVAVGGTVWAVLAEIEEAEIDAQIAAALNRPLLFLLVISVVAVLLLAFLVSRGISGAITDVAATVAGMTGQVLRGDLEARADKTLVSADFRPMVEQINALTGSFVVHLDGMPVPVLVTDLDQRLRFVNAAGAKLAGAARSDLVGRLRDDVLGASGGAGGVDSALSRALAKGRICHYEGPLHPAGRTVEVFSTASPLRTPDNVVCGGLEVLVDQSRSREVERENRRLEERIAQMQRLEAIGTLAGGIAHDFNNILTYMYVHAEVVQELLADKAEAAPHIESLLSGIGRAEALVEQVLSFSRQMRVQVQRFDVVSVVAETLALAGPSLPAEIILETDLPVPGTLFLESDPTLVHQVLTNLFSNGVHALSPQGGRLGVSLELLSLERQQAVGGTTLAAGDYVRLRVSDDGVGMDPATAKRIFEPFFTTRPVGQGTGLGLSVVHGIVRRLGGAINVESEVGSGTTIDVYLSAAPAWPGGASDALPALETLAAVGPILLVDDEVSVCDATQHMLAELGFAVETTTDARTALDRLIADPARYACVITDLAMPGMTGDRLAAAIADLPDPPPVILTTAYADRLPGEGLPRGVVSSLRKPYRRSDLIGVLAQCLSTGPEKG